MSKPGKGKIVTQTRTNPRLGWQPVIVFCVGAALTAYANSKPGSGWLPIVAMVVTWLVANQVSGETVVKLSRPIVDALGERIKNFPTPQLEGTEEEADTVESE